MPQRRNNKPGLFRSLFKSKQEKMLDKIRKKRNKIDELKRKVRFEQSYEKRRKMEIEIDKLKEEIIKMGKYALKDGKLVKNEDTQEVPEEQQMPEQQVEEPVEQPQPRQMPQEPRPIPRQQYQQPQEEEYYEEPQQPQFRQPQYQQSQYQQPQPQFTQPTQPDPRLIAQMQQEELIRQQQARQVAATAAQTDPDVNIFIRLIEGERLRVSIPTEHVEDFINELATAIAQKTTMQINNRIINGRHIIYFSFGEER